MTTRERKPAANQDPWAQESERDTGALLRIGLVVAAILTAGFVWFVGHTMASGSGWGRAIAFLLNLFAVVLLLCAMAGAVLAVVAGAKRTTRVVPKVDGRYPMRYAHLDDVQAVAMVMERLTQSRVLEAGRALPPGVQSVSQSATSNLMDSLFGQEPETVALTPDALVTWAALERAGEIRDEGPILVGWDMIAQAILRLDFKKDLGSTFFLGFSGAGKSTGAAGWAAQIARRGGKLIVCDPHGAEDDGGGHEEESLTAFLMGLSPAFLVPPAASDDEIRAALDRTVDILRARKEGDRDRTPILVVVDEWTSLVMRDDGGKMQDALSFIGLEGRKYEVNACLFAQLGTKAECGRVRDVATSTFTFRTRADHARYAVGRKTDVDIRNYGDGQVYIQARRETFERVQMPLVEPAELVAVGQTLGGGEALPKPQRHLASVGTQPETRWGYRLDDPERITEAEELRIPPLFKIGRSPQQIIWELRHRKPNGTASYRKLKEGVEAVIRESYRDGPGIEEES